jgi:uncharacterized membrane protein YccC
MEGDMNIRASDADRDQVAAALREHFAAGRLTVEEFNDRLERAFSARTLGDLGELMADLPAGDLDLLDQAASPRPAPGPGEQPLDELGPAWRAIWRPWLAITLFFFVLWLVSGTASGAWFVYPSLIVALVLLRRAHRASRRERGEDEAGQDRRQIRR